jgi:hypothetical protein
MMLEVIHELSYGVLQIWGWSAFCLWRGSARRGGVLHRIYHEVKPSGLGRADDIRHRALVRQLARIPQRG